MLMNAHQIPALMETVLTHLDPIIVNVTPDSSGLLPSKHALILMNASRMGFFVRMVDV